MSVAAGIEQPLQLRRHGRLVADDRCVGRTGDAAVGEDPLVVRQRPVDRELLRRGLSRLVDVVVHGHGQPGDDPRRRAAGVGRRLADQREHVRIHRSGVGHPQDRAVGHRAGDAQQARRERGDEQLHRLGEWLRSGTAQGELVTGDVDGLAVQQPSDDVDVLLGVAPGRGVGDAVHPLDHRRVRRTDAEGEPGPSHRPRCRGRTVGLQHRVRRVRLQHRRAELDATSSPGRRRPSASPGRRPRRSGTTAC